MKTWKYKIKATVIACLIFILFSTLYIYTAAPSVYGGDSGELAAGIKNLEIVHPTGFPLYLITAHIFAKVLPLKEYAYRLNIYSAVVTALAMVFMFFVLINLNIADYAAFLAVLVLGFGKTVWFHAGTIDVYSLSLLFTAILLFIFTEWIQTKNIKLIYWYSFVLGISFGTHILMISMLIPLIFMFWITLPKISDKKQWLVKVMALFFLPFVQYFYLLIANGRQKTVTIFRTEGIRELFNYLRQRDYVYKIGARTWQNISAFFWRTASLFASEFSLIFFIIAVLGLFYLYKKHRPLAVLILAAIGVNICIMLFYGNANDLSILFRYYYIAYALLTIPIAYALDFILKRTRHTEIFILILMVSTVMLLVEFQASYAQNNRRNNFIVSDLAHNIMLTAEPNSIIISLGDSITGPLWYLQSIGIRPDIKIIDINLLNYDMYIKNWAKKDPSIVSSNLLDLSGSEVLKTRVLTLLDENIDKHKIYIISTPTDKDIITKFDFLPVGIINEVFRKNTVTIAQLKELNSKNWQRYTLRGIKVNFYRDSFVDQLTQLYAIMTNNLGILYFNAGLFDDAKQAFEKSLEIYPQDTNAINAIQLINQKLNK